MAPTPAAGQLQRRGTALHWSIPTRRWNGRDAAASRGPCTTRGVRFGPLVALPRQQGPAQQGHWDPAPVRQRCPGTREFEQDPGRAVCLGRPFLPAAMAPFVPCSSPLPLAAPSRSPRAHSNANGRRPDGSWCGRGGCGTLGRLLSGAVSRLHHT